MSGGIKQKRTQLKKSFLIVAFALAVAVMVIAFLLHAPVRAQNTNSRLISVYDRGQWSSFLTQAKTLQEALKDAAITLDTHDAVEPSLTEELVAPEYKVNIYRARPVTVVDGAVRKKIVTPYQTAQRIAQDVGLGLNSEDTATLTPSKDFLGDGAGLVLTIDRAIDVSLDLYGKRTSIKTKADTVGDMLAEKGIELASSDRVSLPLKTPITPGLSVRVWREGIQTTTVEQPVGYGTQIVYDADRPVRYRAIETPGVEGVRTITYQIEIKDGVEISRNEINQLITRQPSPQIVVIGIKDLSAGLTQSKGAGYFTDSKGVSHRETYYDLNMSVVMQACGQGGRYTVRFDGMKIDSEGYIIVAANYARYPRCSIVETSAGLARVYDTGGFVARYPDGFDLATDWSRADGI
jgi:resuscitation-promoting factor RpfB